MSTYEAPVPSKQASSGYGPPGGGGYGGPPGGVGGPPVGGYGPPGGFGGPPAGGYGPPPGGFGGAPPGPYIGGPPAGGPRVHPLAVVSLVAGVLSMPACCCWFFGFPLPIVAIACGIIALGKIKNNPLVYKGTGLCMVGLVCGSLGLLMTAGFRFTSYGELFKHRYGKRF